MKPARRYANNRLGRIAQDQVALWLEAAELNKSVSNPDQDGWDFHVSFPRPAPLDGSRFFDCDPPRTSLFVQVKGSVVTTRRQRVALSHWTFASKMPMPWFFVILEFDQPPVPARLFVVHVDEECISMVAKRLREIAMDASDTAIPKLHKLSIDLAWTESHEVPCSAEGLRDALLTHAGVNMTVYAARKRQWLEAAGSDTLRNELRLTFKGPRAQSDQRIAEWALGRTPEIRVDQLRRVEHRWGIPRSFEPTPNVLLSFGVPPSIGKTRVRISDPDQTEHAEFEADVYCNLRFVPFLPRELWAIRLVWGFLEILVRAASPGITVNLSIPDKQPAVMLSELATIARAIRLLATPCRLSYGIPGYDEGREHTHDIVARSQAPEGTELLLAAEAAWAICPLFGLSPLFEITPAELDQAAEDIIEYSLMLTSSDVSAQLETLDQDGLANGEPASFLWFPTVRLGSYQLVVAMMVEGRVQFVGERGRITAKPTFARRWAVASPTFAGPARDSVGKC